MKLISYIYDDVPSIGVLISNFEILDIHKTSNSRLPNNMLEFLNNFNLNISQLKKIIKQKSKYKVIDANLVKIIAPLPNPKSFRDAYAFRQHVEAGRKNRGLEMIPEYDKFPVFYFSNHNSIKGSGNINVEKKHLNKLDFELEVAIVIGKEGKNIKSKDAYEYIAGVTIMNDWSAREMQMEEMKLNLGPAKGKDFATSIGPYITTLDELEDMKIQKDNGFSFNLNMKAFVNGKLYSKDNMKNMTWSFSKIIERASYGAVLYPGDLIGSGTCATGCLLELNLANKTDIWIKEGDTVSLTVDKLGTLKNTIILDK